MPELPEVETVRRHLNRRLKDGRVEEVGVHHRDVISFPAAGLIPEIMVGARFAGAYRRGKFLLLRWMWPHPLPGKCSADLHGGEKAPRAALPPAKGLNLQRHRSTGEDSDEDTPPEGGTIAADGVLLVHLRMTGNMLVTDPREPRARHTHFTMALTAPGDARQYEIRFQDPRRFGRLWLLPAALLFDGAETGPPPPAISSEAAEEALPASLLTLGPEPLSSDFTPEYLIEVMAGRRASVKSLLLQQHIVAGLGNIYVDEVLHDARIHPALPGGELSYRQAELICRGASRILTEAIEYGGTSFSDFRIPDGRWGGMLDRLAVFRREGQPCHTCGGPIEKTRVAQRGTHFCPHCQPLPLRN